MRSDALALNARLSFALESAGEIAFDWSIPDDKFRTERSQALDGLSGSSKSWNTDTLAMIIHDDDRADFRSHLLHRLVSGGDLGGPMHRVQLRMKDTFHEWRWVEIRGRVAERDFSGRATRVLGSLSDIDRRRRFKKMVASDRSDPQPRHDVSGTATPAVEKYMGAILTASLDSIISMNHRGEILSFNEASEATFGYRSEDVIGMRMADMIIPPQWREKHHRRLERYIATGRSAVLNRRIELTAMRADGSTFPVEIAVVPLRVEDSQVFTAFIRDISALKQSQAALMHKARHYQQLVDLSPEAVCVCRQGRLALLNQAAVRVLGAQHASDLLGRHILDFVQPAYHALFQEDAQLPDCDPPSTPFVEQGWQRLDGSRFHAEVAATRLMTGDCPAMQFVVRDITDRKRAEALQLGQNHVLNLVATGAPLTDILTAIAQFVESQSEQGICCISEFDEKCTPKRTQVRRIVAPSLPESYVSHLLESDVRPDGESGGVTRVEFESAQMGPARREQAAKHGLKTRSSCAIRGKCRKPLGTLALYYRDAARPATRDAELIETGARLAGIAIESRAFHEEIRYLAHYDGLTSLPNRFLFKEYLDLALLSARRRNQKFAVFFLDLDKFKDVNDTLGHDAGDQVLAEMATRFTGCLRNTDKIARMGGDEFYILIEDLADARYAADVAQKLLHQASSPLHIAQTECQLSASIGIAIFPEDGVDAPTLLKNADSAMYCAKNLGKDRFQFYATGEDNRLTASHGSMRGTIAAAVD
jgi:diguanylate cyclase (GGDEF)-like protein/PAS domain S-box-containing protein